MSQKKKKIISSLKKKKKSITPTTNCPCVSAHGHFRPLSSLIFSFQFSLHFGEKLFGDPGEKTFGSLPFIFLSSHPTKHTPKKILLLIFS